LSLKRTKVAKIPLVFILLILVVFFVALSGCAGGAETSETKIGVEKETTTQVQPTETTEKQISEKQITGNINILTGFGISDEVLNLRPLAIMINNHTEARPQSGLNKADVLIEVVDEGGITRLIAVYSSKDADIVGPIRSARQYYAELARMFDPIYVFWGTYPEGYKLIENMDLDVLTPLGDTTGASLIQANISEGGDAWRDSSRIAPHNAYSSTQKLKDAAKKNGYSLEGGQSPFSFKLDATNDNRGDVSNVKVDFSVQAFAANFEYEESTNKYTKFTGENKDLDRETNEPLLFNNIIALVTDIANSGDSDGHMIVRTTGNGKALFFFDGNVTEGTWERTSIFDPMQFKDSNGDTVLFNRGSTYIGMVQETDRIIY